MCGLIGLISRVPGGLYGHDLDVFENGLVIDTLRGKDSCGAFIGKRDTTATAIKHGSVPHELFKTRAWADFRSTSITQGKFIIGHNRAATRGEVSTDNAHPFVEGKIVLVHNGTLHNEKELTDSAFAVDSNAVAHALNEGEIEDVLPKIRGAYALIWYNTKTKKLHAIRNEQRPLFLITTQDRYMLASEPWMMAGPWSRQNVASKITSIDEIDAGELYSWDLDGKMTVKSVDISPKVQTPSESSPPGTGVKKTTSGEAGNDSVVFPKGSSNEAGPTTPEAGILRQAMESVQGQCHLKSVTPPLLSCALTQTKDGTGVLTRTTASAWKSNSNGTSELLPRTNEGERHLTGTSESSTTSEQKPIQPSPTGLTLLAAPSIEDMELRAIAKNRVELEEFPLNRRVLCRVLTELNTFKNRPRFVGHLMEPGMEMVSVYGFLPEGVQKGDWIVGAIYFTTISVHGPEVYITNVRKDKTTKIHSRREIPDHLWSLAYLDHNCDKCGMSLSPHEKGFTSITRKSLFNSTKSGNALNVMEVTCADCLEALIPEGEYLESFKARRRNLNEAIKHARDKASRKAAANASAYTPVQEREQGSTGTSSIPGPLTLLPGASVDV